MSKAENAAPDDAPAETSEPADGSPAGAGATESIESSESIEPTDPRARFRAALERKNASPGAHPGSQASDGNRMHTSNGKRQRQFRRKSG